MKKQKIKNLLKLGILIFGLSLFLTNCENNDEVTPIQELDNSLDHTVSKITLNDLMKSNAFGAFEKSASKRKEYSLASKNSTTDTQYEFIGTEVLRSHIDGQTTFTVAIKNANDKEENYDLNLLIKENSFGTSSFIVKYSKLDDSVIIHPVNTVQTNTTYRSTTSKSSGGCTTYLWTASTPCPCAGHTSASSCSSSTQPSSSSGSTTVCWDEPIWVSDNPGTVGLDGITFNGGNGQTAGGTSSDPNYTPIYIYEGEPECYSDGTCTPPLYWAAAQAWSGNSSSTQLMEILNTFSFDSVPLTDAQKQWINNHDNNVQIGLLLDFLRENNNSEDAKEFAKDFISLSTANIVNLTNEEIENFFNYNQESM